MDNYQEFLRTKVIRQPNHGLDIDPQSTNPILFDFQKDVVIWAIKKGRAAIFLDTGLGKTFAQLEWSRLIDEKTLIIAPLSVGRQTVREAKKLSIDIDHVHNQDEVIGKISITNYEMVNHFDFSQFGAVVLDESSILKAIAGKTRKKLTKLCQGVPYRLCCTATPAPNDHIELGNHAEFLGVCTRAEMSAMFFVNANKEHTFTIGDKNYRKKGTNKGGTEWRLKHHAEEDFFKWLASWSIAMTKPSDLGYSDEGFILPPLKIHPTFVEVDYVPEGQLFFTHIKGIKGASEIRKGTAPQRLEVLKELVNNSDEQWIIWVGLNSEADLLKGVFESVIEVRGNHSPDFKANAFEDFQDGKYRILITKPKIGGFGMNFQNAHKMAFFGLSYSWEAFYQCIRREWRYMQKEQVDVYIIMSDIEQSIYDNVMRKDAMAARLRLKLIEQIKTYEQGELKMESAIDENVYQEDTVSGENWIAMKGDSVERLKEIDDNSIDLSVYSPPFADLYTYTDSERDLGNSRDWEEFFEHYRFVIPEILRVTKPGRLTCVHSSDIAAMLQKDGYIGMRNFPGEIIKVYEEKGWIWAGRAFIPKNPQLQAKRKNVKGLLFNQFRKDSTHSRPALADQILLFQKPGDNEVPVTPVENGEMDNDTWIEWANGVWIGIRESDTLKYSKARGEDDEKHICPLQLGTIERCIKLYSNPGEIVLTPFGGIGSEGYQAVKFGRKATLIELKQEYFKILVGNMGKIEREVKQETLFSLAGIEIGESSPKKSTILEEYEAYERLRERDTKRDEYVDDTKVKDFLQDIASIYKKYGFSLAHEDNHGAFIIEPYREDNIDWLNDASIDMRSKDET